MTAYLLLDHIINFLAPAAITALLLVILSWVFKRFLVSKKSLIQSKYAQTAILFIVNLFVLAAGLVFFGNDGKMATYAAMVLTSAVCQWVLWRGWKV